MVIIIGIFGDDEAFDVNAIAFVPFFEVIFSFAMAGNAVVTDQGVSADENLAAIRRVGEGFRIAHHAGVENHFALGV